MTFAVKITASMADQSGLPALEAAIAEWFKLVQITDWEADYTRAKLVTDGAGRITSKRAPFWTFRFGNSDDAMLFKLAFGGSK